MSPAPAPLISVLKRYREFIFSIFVVPMLMNVYTSASPEETGGLSFGTAAVCKGATTYSEGRAPFRCRHRRWHLPTHPRYTHPGWHRHRPDFDSPPETHRNQLPPARNRECFWKTLAEIGRKSKNLPKKDDFLPLLS